MRKSVKILLTLLISSIIILISMSIYNRIKIQNIFDEIYYDSRNASGEGWDRRSSLGSIKGMSASATNLSSESERIIVETYRSGNLSAPMKSLSIMNNSTKKDLEISYSYTLTQNISIFFENIYNVKTRELTKAISFVEANSGKRITDQKEVEETIKTYKITDEQLAAWNHQGMDEVFLKDWLSVYPSRYSSEKPGNVSVNTQW
ncbi:hypothetical protein IGI37_001389 [Enterococcus sp. AZ194]